MGRSQREKGKRGERMGAAAVAAALGVFARRGVQFHGGPASADIVVEVDGVHWEVKFVEREAVRSWMAQAREECGGKVPVVLHKRSRDEWLVTVPLERLHEFATKVLAAGPGPQVQAVGPGALPGPIPAEVLPPGP